MASAPSVRSTLAPQCEQNLAPSKIIPKQEGQATVASRAPQCAHEVASEAAGAPHIGQFNVSASMVWLSAICAGLFPRRMAGKGAAAKPETATKRRQITFV